MKIAYKRVRKIGSNNRFKSDSAYQKKGQREKSLCPIIISIP